MLIIPDLYKKLIVFHSDFIITQVAETLVSKSVVNQKLNANGGMSSSSIDRVQAERTQIYDRLSLSSIGNVEHINNIFARFSIPLNVKKKKVALTESLCASLCGHFFCLLL